MAFSSVCCPGLPAFGSVDRPSSQADGMTLQEMRLQAVRGYDIAAGLGKISQG